MSLALAKEPDEQPPIKKCCGNCKHWVATPLKARNMGECRIGPPGLFLVEAPQGPTFVSQWPPVLEHEKGCSQFEENWGERATAPAPKRLLGA